MARTGIVVDSSVLVAHLRGASKSNDFLEGEQRRGAIVVPAFVAWELWKGASTIREKAGAHELLGSVDPFSAPMAQIAGDMHTRLATVGRTPPAFDLLIASHALFHGLPLATEDRDYSVFRSPVHVKT